MKVGDVVLVKAKFVKYNTLIEITNTNLTSMVISKKTVEDVATTATKKTKDEMIAMTSKAEFSKGEYLEFDNAKAFKDGSHINVNIEGTVAKIGLTALKGVSFDLDKWGTFKGYVLSMNNNVTFCVDWTQGTSLPIRGTVRKEQVYYIPNMTVQLVKTVNLTSNGE